MTPTDKPVTLTGVQLKPHSGEANGMVRMTDPTETIRRDMVKAINAAPGSREYLEHEHGQVWDTDQLQQEFDVMGFMAPLIVVSRKCDGVKGSLMFQHDPRFYFDFQPE